MDQMTNGSDQIRAVFGFGVRKTALKFERFRIMNGKENKWVRYQMDLVTNESDNCLNQWARIWLRGTENRI